MDTKQQGFTMIELVMVIVILGILAAALLPMLTNLKTDARISVLKDMYAAVVTGTTLSHSKAIIEGADLTSDNLSIDLDGDGTPERLAYGYPKSNNKHTMEWIIEDLGDFTYNPGLGRYILQTDCYVQYTEPNAPGASPQATIQDSGC